MRRTHSLPVILLLLAAPLLRAQVVWFADTFNRTDLGPAWNAGQAAWTISNGVLRISTTSYDEMLPCSLFVFDTRPYSIEAVLRGARAGLFFSIDDPSTKALSQMVRFDDAAILAGYFTGGGEFVATSSFGAPHAPLEWTRLRIDVDPPARRYRVFVDGRSVGEDTLLRFSSGYVGLQASDGHAEFRSFAVAGAGPRSAPALPEPGSVVRFDHVASVGTTPRGILILDPVRNAVLTLDERGVLVAVEPALPDSGLLRRTISAGAAGVRAEIRGGTVVLTDSGSDAPVRVLDRLVAPSAVMAGIGPSFYIADPGAGAVFRFSTQGEFIAEHRAELSGGFHGPRGIAPLDTDRLVVADHDRLVVLHADLREEEPVVEHLVPSGVRLSWSGDTGGDVRFRGEDGVWRSAEAKSSGSGSWSAIIKGVPPLHRIVYRVPDPTMTIPPSGAYSRELRCTTPPAAPGMLALARIPVLLMVYRTISYRDVYPRNRHPEVPDGRRISDEELAGLRAAAVFNSAFFFRNSACAVVLDFDLFVVEDTLRLGEVGDTDPYWLGPNDRVTRDYELAAATLGHPPEFYNGLVVPYAWINHPARRASALRDTSRGDTVTIRQMYGGGTYGVPAPWKYGATSGYTANPFQDRFSRQDWLITHEFHHQLDALMEAASFSSYHHADQPWKMPGRFGEDFDFNAAIIRKAGRAPWLALNAGRLVAVADADSDGVPDNDPSLPFDERRIGSRTDRRDTDGDGLSDLAEVMAGIEGGSDPAQPDTDGDGVADGLDPYPLYPIPTTIRILRGGKSGCPSAVDLVPFARADSMTAFHLAADDSALYAGFSARISTTAATADLGFLLQVDADGDGWFHGFDNTQVRLRWRGDSVKVVDYYLRDCASWSAPPKDRKDILRPEDLRIEHRVRPGADGDTLFVLCVRLPFHTQHGPHLKGTRPMRFRFGFQTTEDRWVWREAFERNVMVAVGRPER